MTVKSLLWLALFAVCCCATASAQRPNHAVNDRASEPLWAVTPELAAKLTSPFQSTSSGTPVRELVHSVAAVAQINLWFDRQLDSAETVTLTAGPKTVYQTLQQIAAGCGAELAVADNVVLFGQPDRVRRLAGAIWGSLADSRGGVYRSASLIDVAWPMGATPDEALASVGRHAVVLPHDHWPAAQWKQLRPATAALLITAQFDQQLHAGQLAPLTPPAELAMAYPPIAMPDQLLAAAQRIDRRAAIGGGNQLQTTISGHLTVIDQLFQNRTQPAGETAAAGRPSGTSGSAAVDIDRVRFTLTLGSARARTALQQLATAAGRQLEVAAEADQAVERLIDLQVQDQSLRAIAAQVASKAGVQLHWDADTVRVTLLP